MVVVVGEGSTCLEVVVVLGKRPSWIVDDSDASSRRSIVVVGVVEDVDQTSVQLGMGISYDLDLGEQVVAGS